MPWFASSGFDFDQSGIKLSVFPLISKVADPAVDGVLATSNSGVARVAIGGLTLPQLDAVTAPIEDVDLEAALHSHERRQQSNWTGARDQDALVRQLEVETHGTTSSEAILPRSRMKV